MIPMASADYRCGFCDVDLNLRSDQLYPPDFTFESGNKGTLSFISVDSTKYTFEKEDRFSPFFETINYWGLHRHRTKIKCRNCSNLLGYIYDDGAPLSSDCGQFGMGPSQVIPRAPRYRLKKTALRLL